MKVIALKDYDPSKSARIIEVINILRLRGYRWQRLHFDWNEVTLIKENGSTETFRIERSE